MLYTIEDHTADIRLYVEAESIENLFKAALQGIAHIMNGHKLQAVGSYSIKYNINISSPDITLLLIDFLSEIITQSAISKSIFYDVVFTKITEHELEGMILGNRCEVFNEDIKAVTYHEANIIKNNKGNYSTTIVLDI